MGIASYFDFFGRELFVRCLVAFIVLFVVLFVLFILKLRLELKLSRMAVDGFSFPRGVGSKMLDELEFSRGDFELEFPRVTHFYLQDGDYTSIRQLMAAILSSQELQARYGWSCKFFDVTQDFILANAGIKIGACVRGASGRRPLENKIVIAKFDGDRVVASGEVACTHLVLNVPCFVSEDDVSGMTVFVDEVKSDREYANQLLLEGGGNCPKQYQSRPTSRRCVCMSRASRWKEFPTCSTSRWWPTSATTTSRSGSTL